MSYILQYENNDFDRVRILSHPNSNVDILDIVTVKQHLVFLLTKEEVKPHFTNIQQPRKVFRYRVEQYGIITGTILRMDAVYPYVEKDETSVRYTASLEHTADSKTVKMVFAPGGDSYSLVYELPETIPDNKKIPTLKSLDPADIEDDPDAIATPPGPGNGGSTPGGGSDGGGGGSGGSTGPGDSGGGSGGDTGGGGGYTPTPGNEDDDDILNPPDSNQGEAPPQIDGADHPITAHPDLETEEDVKLYIPEFIKIRDIQFEVVNNF